MAAPGTTPMPKLPGFVFDDRHTRAHHGNKATFASINGYLVPVAMPASPGQAEDAEATSSNPGPMDAKAMGELTTRQMYTTTSRAAAASGALPIRTPAHVPAHVAMDKKVLTFNGYFKETVHESQDEHYRVRHVKVFYYLEDDTMSILEPTVPNSGLPQGKLIRRQRLPKDSEGNTFLWKDLNVGMTITVYGRAFRLTACDRFTQDFLESNGIVLNPTEEAPVDPYLVKRQTIEHPSTLATTPSDYDQLMQFLTLDRKVLRFYALWDDRKAMFGERRPYILHYFLVDDTLEVREQHTPNNGRDHFPLLLRRQKVLRNHRALPSDFPSIVLEPSAHENSDFLGPQDLMIGRTVQILGRDFLIYDCDAFTQEFYRRNFGVEDFTPLDVAEAVPAPAPAEPPLHVGFGSYEDSLQSVLSLQPKPPRSNVNKLLKYENKTLRFAAHLETDNPIEAERRFILCFHLAADTISIFEPKTRLTFGGKFLEAQRIVVPGSERNPVYYGASDLYIGAHVHVFGRTFVLDDCDAFVVKFAEEHAQEYTPEALRALRAHSVALAEE